MKSLVLLAALGGWTYGGFVAPPAKPPPARPAPFVPAPPAPPKDLTRWDAGAGQWRGADSTGQEWTHPDRAFLERFLAER